MFYYFTKSWLMEVVLDVIVLTIIGVILTAITKEGLWATIGILSAIPGIIIIMILHEKNKLP